MGEAEFPFLSRSADKLLDSVHNHPNVLRYEGISVLGLLET
jgi:hypothetical protein